MGLWSDLLGRWGGVLSLRVILFILSIAGFIAWFVKNSG
ncbi:MAG: DUF3149 domain-containing protein [Cycloclasticus sp.]